MSRVLLVNMPFANLRWPSLGLGLLKAGLARRGIGCDVAYFNFDFAERIGLDCYHWIADHFAFVLGGERLFAKEHFGGQLPSDDEYYREVLLSADPELAEEDRHDYEEGARHVGPFLDACMTAVDWSQYAVVGFAASFQQTVASLCLARRIKRLRPETKIAFGGAACADEMGVELWRQSPEIDYVFLGEADGTFPAVVEQLLTVGQVAKVPPGVVGQVAKVPYDQAPLPPAMVRNLDDLPYPDFDDYFARLQRSPLCKEIDPLLFFETSRGCWWGEKHQCAFCGLNGPTLGFRRKGPQRAVDELRYLLQRHDVHGACASDNILDYRYFDTFLPLLGEARLDLRFAYEMKTNLRRRQVQTLLEAGLVSAQLGIETFITPILKLIGKGANALQNLQALKWFSEAGIEVKWNLLYGFPNEDPAEYAALAALLPSLVHLAPPTAVGRVRLDRFSPYFRDPAAHGMTNVRPHRAFRHVYPFPREVLARLAYYHEFDYADGRDPLDYAAPAIAAAERWQHLGYSTTLRYWDRADGVLIITDTRPAAAVFQRRLVGWERELYLFCDEGRSWRKIVARAEASPAKPPLDPSHLRRALEEWVEQRIMAHLDGRYLGLALHQASDGP